MKKPMSKTKKIIYDILFVIALAVFLFSAYKLISIYYLNYQEGKEKDAVQEVAKVPKNPEKEDFTIDWKALKEKNPEVVGWILIPDTDISYPIVQGSDNSYYLNHTFEKKENYAGAIFMDAGADASFQDRNTIIYGHNVKHGTMFAELEKFKEQAFFEQHPYLYIFTEQQNYRCEIFSMYSTSATSASYRLQYADDADFKSYVDMVRELSDFNRKVSVKGQDRIVSLSTCSYERDGQPSELRYLLHAAEAILKDPERYDEMTERFSPSTGETKVIMMKYIYQGSAIRYNRRNVYKKDQIKEA